VNDEYGRKNQKKRKKKEVTIVLPFNAVALLTYAGNSVVKSIIDIFVLEINLFRRQLLLRM
jgi:hypothetical protein